MSGFCKKKKATTDGENSLSAIYALDTYAVVPTVWNLKAMTTRIDNILTASFTNQISTSTLFTSQWVVLLIWYQQLIH